MAKRVDCEIAASPGVSWPVVRAAFTTAAADLRPAQPASAEVLRNGQRGVYKRAVVR